MQSNLITQRGKITVVLGPLKKFYQHNKNSFTVGYKHIGKLKIIKLRVNTYTVI